MSPLTFITVYYADWPCKYALPLLCLLLERVVWTMDTAKTLLVSPKEILLLGVSIKTVVASLHIRADKLQGQVL